MILFLLSFLIIIVVGLLDGCLASVVAGFFILFVSSLQSRLSDKSIRQYAFKVNQITFLVYFLVSFVFSFAFANGDFFAVSDPSRYIENYWNSRSFFNEKQNIIDCYFEFADNNALYNSYLRAICVFGNNVLGGTSVFYLTLAQTLFGIMSVNVLFRILSRYLERKAAYKATLSYAFFSIILFYSCVILRDIIIVYLFILSIEIVLKPFKSVNLLKLILLMIVTWGIRLYSGLFMVSFIGLYIYLYAQHTRMRAIALPIFILLMLVAGAALVGSAIMEQTATEISDYTEMTMGAEEEKGGLISFLYRLPPGISQIAIMFYSQMAPFPPFLRLATAYSVPSFVMSICIIVYAVFWFFVFYTLCASFISLKAYKYYGKAEMLLFLIAIIYILANTAHPDLRRMMPVYPITYLLYVVGRDRFFPHKWLKNTRSTLMIGYMGLLIVYIAIKGI